MIFRLAQIHPPEILTQSPDPSFPLRRSIGDPGQWLAPPGCHYLPVVEQSLPPINPAVEQLSYLPDTVVGSEIHTRRYEVIPRSIDFVSPRQFRLALLSEGITDAMIRGSSSATMPR